MIESQNVIDLRAQIAKGGKVIIPPGRYYFNDTLVLSGTTSLVGDYRDLCTLDFTQMQDPTKEAIRIDRVWGYEISNVVIVGNRAANAIGVLNSTVVPNANGSYGTCSGSAILNHVIIAGFKKGLVIGDGTKYIAASENVYIHLQVVQCDTCIELNDYNTLNHKFIMLQMGDCNTGMSTKGASFISVDGGSFSSCKGVLFAMSSCSASRFRDCRMEDSFIFLFCGTTCTASNHIIDGCQIHQRASVATEKADVKSPIIVGGSAILTVKNSFISQTALNWPVIWDQHNCNGGLIEAIGNTTTIDPSVTPFIQAHPRPGCRRLTRNNMWTDGGQVFKGWHLDENTN